MKPLHELYTEEIYHELRPYYANWMPDQPVALGDFGILDGKRFTQLGNLSKFQISFSVIKKQGTPQQHFCSKGTVNYLLHAKGTGGSLNACVELGFKKSGAVFFNLAGCHYDMIADKVALGQAIETLYRNGPWKLEWVIITDLVSAHCTTVAISNTDDAKLTLAAETSVPNIDFADASVELKVSSSKGVGYQVISAPGLSPLFAFARLRKRWFDDPEFGPDSRKFAEGDSDEPELWLEDVE